MNQIKKQNLYRILGVEPDANSEEIRKGYLHMAKMYHPDLAGADSSLHFIAISGAFEILSDPARKKEYDDSLKNTKPFPNEQEQKRYNSSNNPESKRIFEGILKSNLFFYKPNNRVKKRISDYI